MIRNQRYTQTKLSIAKRLRREMTRAEEAFWAAVKGNKLNGLHFRRQQIIDGFIADFYCSKLRLVVEIDGGVHERQNDYDSERDRIIKMHGIKVMRFPNHEVLGDMDGVLAKILNFDKN
jgi:very-short-patch-repair endonuclease